MNMRGKNIPPHVMAAVLLGLSLSAGTYPQGTADASPGLKSGVVFTEYSPLSRSAELARRTLSPLANLALTRALGASSLRDQGIDLARETFSVYVPARRPAQGFGLLVFIPPWQDSRLPAGWASLLDEVGVIFVSAAKSGNEENVLGRRIPLALLAAANIKQRYAIDEQRIYIAGFSGGSRIALRTALSYPDLFRGAILNAGSDPIGGQETLLPTEDMFNRFQESSRVVYVTGDSDEVNLKNDMGSRESMNHWCVFGTAVEPMSGRGHEVAPPQFLRRALEALDKPASSIDDGGKLSACRNQIRAELAEDLQRVRELLDRNKSGAAQRALTKLDVRYGGLAAPASLELWRRIAPPQ